MNKSIEDKDITIVSHKKKELISSLLMILLGIALQILPNYIEPLIYPATELRGLYQWVINIVSIISIITGVLVIISSIISHKKKKSFSYYEKKFRSANKK